MSEKPPLTVRIKHNLWPVVGDCTLMGLYAEARLADTRGENKFDHDKLLLEIEQTSMGYRRDHGPAEMIVTEFVPLCLIRDVLSMTKKHNIDIQIEVIEIHTEPNFER